MEIVTHCATVHPIQAINSALWSVNCPPVVACVHDYTACQQTQWSRQLSTTACQQTQRSGQLPTAPSFSSQQYITQRIPAADQYALNRARKWTIL